MRSVWTRAVFSLGEGGYPPYSGCRKPPQIALAFFQDSARVGIVTSLLRQFGFYKTRFGGFFFVRSSGAFR
jgi:hypothetical protein